MLIRCSKVLHLNLDCGTPTNLTLSLFSFYKWYRCPLVCLQSLQQKVWCGLTECVWRYHLMYSTHAGRHATVCLYWALWSCGLVRLQGALMAICVWLIIMAEYQWGKFLSYQNWCCRKRGHLLLCRKSVSLQRGWWMKTLIVSLYVYVYLFLYPQHLDIFFLGVLGQDPFTLDVSIGTTCTFNIYITLA